MEIQSRQWQEHRVRKRARNACSHCRQQKIRCSGTAPCEQCKKKDLLCNFESEHQKVLVTRGFLANLKRQALVTRRGDEVVEQHRVEDGACDDIAQDGDGRRRMLQAPTSPSYSNDISDVELESRKASSATEEAFTNPLVSGRSVYLADSMGRPSYLGTSSNESFGRRLLSNAHERVYASPLPAASLLFDGQTYELGLDGPRTSLKFDDTALPTADFALFLINAVKFHCGQLFHLFDEQDFMRNFSNYHDHDHEEVHNLRRVSDLWRVHYLLVLALGKALIVRVGQARRPPGADLYLQAMSLLPDTPYLCRDPILSMEILCCAALYLQCLDMRTSALIYIGQAVRMAVVHGIHTDIQSRHHSETVTERCREVWWTIYVLDCHLSSLMGTPLALAEQDISAQLPSFAGASHKSLAMSIHVKLAKTTTMILKTVYGEEGRMDDRFLVSIKKALKRLASVNDERDRGFPLNLKDASSSISRLSAYLHLFYHQCIILTTRPLLYALWQKKVDSSIPVRIGSVGSVGSLVRICVSSAHETLKILAVLQAQSLLESFIPFDLESTWSSAVVLMLTKVIEPSLLRKNESWLQKTHVILDEMISRGNLISALRKTELQQLDETLTRLHSAPASSAHMQDSTVQGCVIVPTGGEGMQYSNHNQMPFEPLRDWNSEEGLSGDQLIAVADSLDFTDLDWLSSTPIGQLEEGLH